MTELGPLPEEWEVIRLGEVCKVDWGNTSLTKKLYTANGYPAFSAAGNDGFLDFYEHDGEAVILSAIGARSGKCFYASGKWTAIKNTIVIKSNNETKINLLFLYFFVNNENYWHKSGSGQPFISIGVAQKQKLPLPPLPEQQKMAAVLSAVQEAKEKTRAVIAATKALKKSMMKHLFTYGPVSPEETETVLLKETEIGPVPEDWEVVRLGEVGEFQYGYTETASSKKIGPKFLRITDIDLTGSKIKWADVPYCKISDKDYLKYKLIDEDILFTRIGATTGKTCIVKSPPESVFASYLIRFKVDLEKALPFFIYHFTTNKGYWNQINASKEGKLKKGVSSSQLKIFQIPLPPLPIQQKIASILSAIDAKIEAEENKKKALEE
ncbi:MAG TPA: restriction endonuclease subunit S, partial [Candidatus Cloacimonas sp.]|nr:restriction endonuclease subunit S [Candidatus Cloacimonas sp.]